MFSILQTKHQLHQAESRHVLSDHHQPEHAVVVTTVGRAVELSVEVRDIENHDGKIVRGLRDPVLVEGAWP